MPTIANFRDQAGLLARAVSAYAQQEYTDARYLAGSQLLGSDARISVSDEDYFGTIRWDETLGANSYTQAAVAGATNVNYGEEVTTDGLTTDFSTAAATYIKSQRNVGASDYNLTQVISRREGAVAKLGSQFGRVRARDEDAALLAVIQGVLNEEVSNTASSGDDRFGQQLGDPLRSTTGFFFDCNGPNAMETTNTDNASANTGTNIRTLIDTSEAGGKAAKRIFEAMAAGYGDLEPDFMYLITDPETFYDMRIANLLDEGDRITDGNIEFNTLLQGKIRVFVTRTAIGDFSPTPAAGAAVNGASDKTSLLCLPGSIAMVDLPMVNPVEFDSDASTGRGTGNREAWYRWGYVMHPRGYTWAGSTATFAENANRTSGSNQNRGYSAGANWNRVEDPGNLGILPIFHA